MSLSCIRKPQGYVRVLKYRTCTNFEENFKSKNKQQYNGEIKPIYNRCSESNKLVNSSHEKLISTSYHSIKANIINGPTQLQEAYPNQCQLYFTATRKFSSTATVYAAGK